ncbi:MAG: hypothetical protein KME22_02840 [Hassallia sp. WJT32-NPBG1]|nr:hypothetical protein [Hassallia sp. WJT32-NPBG1]
MHLISKSVNQFDFFLHEVLYRPVTVLEIRRDLVKKQHVPYWLITVSYKLFTTQALINWCDETLAKLTQL